MILKVVRFVLAAFGTLIVVAIMGPLLWSFLATPMTDRAYCVVVAQASDFTGTYLRHRNAVSKGVMTAEACRAQDQQWDQGDGMRAGRVRWAVCRAGPDCDEAGNF